MLIALYEHNTRRGSWRSRKPRLLYHALGPVMLTIRDLGGSALGARSAPRGAIFPIASGSRTWALREAIFPATLGSSTSSPDSGAGSSTLAQVPVVPARADDSEDESTHSSDPDGLRKENRKETKKIEREARLAQLDNRDASFDELQAIAKKEFADDKAAEEQHIRGERGMVRPADTDPDLRGDRTRSSDTQRQTR
jgi:hypothetical protein